ncbi:homocysteine S-methyltransferase family protein [Candidatus Soleaferrea massiliensis]|uniref:homocysteine S-methyltransferase family protein n=1 Tax=Candidatus Soleaferrea massiliensis TaxID=1470354 RepID=UPI00058D3DA4|nr:homocysteine S-methyltransferase family protein [Candidatus Soleaferrea massiliensis]
MAFPFKLPLLLDGAAGTNLIAADMPQGVCVEDWVKENPQVMQRIQAAFLEAGADVLYAPTFGANREKLSHYLLEDQTQQINKALVSMTKETAESEALVAGDMSPTGLFVEPFGEASFKQLVKVYEEQAACLKKAGADLLVIETMFSLAEIRAAILGAKKTGLPIFVTITVDDDGRTITGLDARTALLTVQAMGVSAFGLNCSEGPQSMAANIQRIAPYTEIPLIGKPNAGHPDPEDPSRYDLSPEAMGQAMKALFEAGVQIAGGCCGTTPDHLAAIRKAMDAFDFKAVNIQREEPAAVLLANESESYFLSRDTIRLSEPVTCGEDMEDALLDIDEDACDAALIMIENPEDGYEFSLNAHMLHLPVVFRAKDEKALERALFYYQGIAGIDSACGISVEAKERLAQRYGSAIL